MDCKVNLWRLLTSTLLLFWLAPVSAADVPDPQIVKQNGVKTLLLPDSFIQKINADYPGFRIPTRDDLTGLWSHWEARMYGFPFICWGDFNGDGLVDIAAFLLGNQASKFILFHKSGQGYVRELIDEKIPSTPTSIILSTIPLGEVKVFEGYDIYQDKVVRIEETYSHDAIEYFVVDSHVEVLHYEDGTYMFERYGDE